MSWLFSQALVAEYLADTSLDGEPSALLNGNPTQQAYCAPDKMTAFSRLSRFGMTYKPLTASHGEELLTLYRAGFLAKTSQPLGGGLALMESAAGCGEKWRASFTKYNPDLRLWKTHQCSLLGDLEPFLETWPQWGLMRDGECWEQQTLAQTIKGTEFGLWATPSATDGQRGGTITDKMTGQSLPQMVNTPAKWPTPQASDNRPRGTFASTQKRMEKGKQISLEAKVKWTTPTAHMAKETNAPSEYLRNTPTLTAQAGGSLNPTWVEWLMGWPLGWTDLKPLAMDKSHFVPQQLGESCNELL
mgnify:CR=1 FL=1